MAGHAPCANCGDAVERSGNNYRHEPLYVHVSTRSTQCSLFARPVSEEREGQPNPAPSDDAQSDRVRDDAPDPDCHLRIWPK